MLRISPHFGYYSQLFTVGYRRRLVPMVVLVSSQLPASDVFSACYCLDRLLCTSVTRYP